MRSTRSIVQRSCRRLVAAVSVASSLSGARLTVIGGPFAESKELVGGFAVLRAASKAEAIEPRRRFMQIHADVLGPSAVVELEIREMSDPPPGQPWPAAGRTTRGLSEGDGGLPHAAGVDSSCGYALTLHAKGREVWQPIPPTTEGAPPVAYVVDDRTVSVQAPQGAALAFAAKVTNNARRSLLIRLIAPDGNHSRCIERRDQSCCARRSG